MLCFRGSYYYFFLSGMWLEISGTFLTSYKYRVVPIKAGINRLRLTDNCSFSSECMRHLEVLLLEFISCFYYKFLCTEKLERFKTFKVCVWNIVLILSSCLFVTA